MSTDPSEQGKGDRTKPSHALPEGTLNATISLTQTLKDELLIYIETNISRRSDWLLAIAGGTFAALISSGRMQPKLLNWQTKELLIALAISSLLGVIVKLFWNERLRLITLTKADIENIKETFAQEVGDNPEKSQILQKTLNTYLQSEILNLFKGIVSDKKYAKLRRQFTVGATSENDDRKNLRNQIRRSFFLQCQFWTLLLGILTHVVLVLSTY
jgi:hypothetical protein